MNLSEPTADRSLIEKALLLIIFLVFLYLLSEVLSLFLGVFTYALILTVSFSKLFERLSGALRGKRSLAAAIYLVLAISIIAIPFIFMVNAAANYIHLGQVWYEDLKKNGAPPIPEWTEKIPFVHEKIKSIWTGLSSNANKTIALNDDQIKEVFKNLISGGLGIVGAGVELIHGIILSAILLAKGEKILISLKNLVNHIVGDKWGPEIMTSAGKAILGVSIGVMGSAFIEGVLTWVGFSIEGLAIAPLLAVIVFLLATVQAGPLLVFIPAIIWQFSTGQIRLAVISTIVLAVLMVVDNVLMPILIGKSGKLPIYVLFVGVVGGLAAWGFTGIFKGAMIMAVLYTLLQSWMDVNNQSNNRELKTETVIPATEE